MVRAERVVAFSLYYWGLLVKTSGGSKSDRKDVAVVPCNKIFDMGEYRNESLCFPD